MLFNTALVNFKNKDVQNKYEAACVLLKEWMYFIHTTDHKGPLINCFQCWHYSMNEHIAAFMVIVFQ
jgi:hypothetical protein